MGEIISQIAMIVAVLLWAAARRKSAAEGWKGRRRQRAPGSAGPNPVAQRAERSRDEDVVWGTRPLRHPPRPSAGQAPRAPRPRAADAAMPAAGQRPRGAGRGNLADGGLRYAESLADVGTQAAATTLDRGAHAWERLGIGGSRSAKRAGLRKAILLREILGKPRAMRGPAGRRPLSS